MYLRCVWGGRKPESNPRATPLGHGEHTRKQNTPSFSGFSPPCGTMGSACARSSRARRTLLTSHGWSASPVGATSYCPGTTFTGSDAMTAPRPGRRNVTFAS